MCVLQGFTFPVKQLFLEDVLETTGYAIGADQTNVSGHGGRRSRMQEKKKDALLDLFEVNDFLCMPLLIFAHEFPFGLNIT